MKKSFFIFCFAQFFYTLTCLAQADELKPVADQLDATARPGAYIPFDLMGTLAEYTNVRLSSDFKNSIASADFVIDNKHSKNIDHLFALRFQQTVLEDAQDFTPFDLSGLTKGTTIKIGYQLHYWNPSVSDKEFERFDYIRYDYAKRAGITDRNAIRALNYANLDRTAQRRVSKLFKPHLFFTLQYALNNKKFNYITNLATFQDITEYKINQQGTASAGVLFGRKRNQSFYLSFSLNSIYQNAAAPIDLIIPYPASTAYYYKKNVVVGVPAMALTKILSATYRLLIYNKDDKAIIGIAPGAMYSINNANAGFQLPVYFISGRNAKYEPVGLTGGVRFGYLTNFKHPGSIASADRFKIEFVIAVPFAAIGDVGK